MSKLAFLFPGQGAQYVGMGKELYDNYLEAQKIFDEANEALGFEISKLCFEGPEDKLMLTKNTQPAILTMSIAALNILKSKGITPDIAAGLSLGEYSALVCAGVLKFSDAVKTVEKRGSFMQEAVPEGKGAMAALIGIDRENAVKLCNDFSSFGILEPANFNCPGQIVIGGEKIAVEKAVESAKDYGSKKAVILPVSAPFHTSMLKPAAIKLEAELDKISFNEPFFPVISNIDAKIPNNLINYKLNLVNQVSSSVLWEDTIINMIAYGVDTFVEIGPGSSLCGFVKKIDRNLNFMNIENIASLEKAMLKLEDR
jgi:[acyl-carrier-protein] S-malonyltransferase